MPRKTDPLDYPGELRATPSGGPSDYVRKIAEYLLGGDKFAASMANRISGMTDYINPAQGAYEGGRALAEADLAPSPETAAAAGLTLATMTPIGRALRAAKVGKDVARTARIGVGPRSIGWDLRKVSEAESLEKSKIGADKIKMLTGLERDADGQWTQEISDQMMVFDPGPAMGFLGKKGVTAEAVEKHGVEGPLGMMVKHPDLYQRYPQLEHDYKLKIKPKGSGRGGAFQRGENELSLNWDTFLDPSLKNEFGARKTTIHELSHAVKDIEGSRLTGANVNEMGALKSKAAHAESALHYRQALEEAQQSVPNFWMMPLDKRDELTNAILAQKGLAPPSPMASMIGTAFKAPDLEKFKALYPKTKDLSSFDMYQSEAGEVAARNDARRADYNPLSRALSLLRNTEDISRRKQLIRGRDF